MNDSVLVRRPICVGLTDAIKGAPDILFVPGAGNSNDDVDFAQRIPAGIDLPNVLAAGAVDLAGDPAAFTRPARTCASTPMAYGSRVSRRAVGA